MMSAAQSQPTLEALQSHFTWDLNFSRSKLFRFRDKLKDIGTNEGNSWLGHIYNLQGFIHYQLGFIEEAKSFFSRATEAFHQMMNTVSDGPWLLVNYGNLAWMHHHLGEQAESERYLSKVHALMKEYPSPSEDQLHPEIYAEKAWTLMTFCEDKKHLAAEYFQRAIRMQPDRVEWQTSCMLALVSVYKRRGNELRSEMKKAKERDPENLYLAALYLEACAQRGTNVKEEAHELAKRILSRPVSSYSGFTPLMTLYKTFLHKDEAIILAEEALKRHPDERHLKKHAAICYKEKILSQSDSPLEPSMINRAISLSEEVISLYPDSSLKMQITLANLYAESKRQDEGNQIFKDLLKRDLEDKEKQMVYNGYAKFLYFSLKKEQESIKYHMMAAEIPQQSFYREDSIEKLEKIKKNKYGREIEEFLANLQR
ncbi:interferon-induced protein with tetratricopeptide repeats 2-like [Mugil cephalus]|uniref:interferon-induced protein with tetratricopeptide repeats 2-like n=1 Tax=Mugil cephalus TaxID=48193 RepID=UPI001FB5A2FD|nr:interferon-induced protein with tetratricopeptide repeats 2-like [Mugil cephalus]XP_047443585.1 interferon-induced protein with tetratricopeptide repeats 2-like [Mugil cephalus]